ncbi:MAG: phosphate acyltransferase, partial [Parvibaculum sp.]
GLVVKSHGGTDAQGFASAIDVAVDVASADLLKKIVADLEALDGLEQVAQRRAQTQINEESEAVIL